MNKEVRKAVTNLMVTMENEICEDCELARMMSEMAQDVRCEFILASKLRNHDECIDVLNEMLDCCFCF